MYHSPLIHKVINLFKSTELNIAFRTCNTIYNQLHNRSPQTNTDSSGIYRLQCKTCDKSYVGQIGRSIAIRYLEHIQYIRTNIPVSAYALYILNNRHEYGSLEHTIQLLQACSKGKMMNWRDSFYMQVLQQQNLLTEKHKTTEPNPLYALGNITKQHHTTRHTLKTQYILGWHNNSTNRQVSPSLKLYNYTCHFHDTMFINPLIQSLSITDCITGTTEYFLRIPWQNNIIIAREILTFFMILSTDNKTYVTF